MRILITGGAGFIGSGIADAYVAEGHEIMVVDDLSSGKKENVPPAARFVLCDIASDTAVEAVKAFRPEVVSHHAARVDVRASLADPVFDAQVNIVAAIRLLEACRANGVRKFIYASSAAGYGEPERVPTDEAHPLRPATPCAAAKVSVERYLDFYRGRYGLESTALRYGNVYGPRQDPHGEGGAVAIFCRRMLRGQAAIVNGDGEQTRDYVYVGDVVRANLAALSRGGGRGINIGTGIETSVNTLFRTLRELAGSRQEEIHGPAVAGEGRRACLENRLALEELGWYPEVFLEEGLARTYSFFRETTKDSDTW